MRQVKIAGMVVGGALVLGLLSAALGGPIPPDKRYSGPAVSISEVKSRLPLKSVGDGFELIGMLYKLKETGADAEKADILISIYESQNTADNDMLPDGVPPPMERQLQLEALGELTRIPTEACAKQVLKVLRDYLSFTNASPVDNPRSRLQLSMAYLIRAHVSDGDIRAIATEYLNSPVFAEWTKGRIATGVLGYRVAEIADSADPELTQRLSLIMETACLPSLEEMLKAPKRIAFSANILGEITGTRPEKLANYIESKKDWSDSQKYFLAYASLSRVVRKAVKQEPVSSGDIELVNRAKQWQSELAPKTADIENGDQVLDIIAERCAGLGY